MTKEQWRSIGGVKSNIPAATRVAMEGISRLGDRGDKIVAKFRQDDLDKKAQEQLTIDNLARDRQLGMRDEALGLQKKQFGITQNEYNDKVAYRANLENASKALNTPGVSTEDRNIFMSKLKPQDRINLEELKTKQITSKYGNELLAISNLDPAKQENAFKGLMDRISKNEGYVDPVVMKKMLPKPKVKDYVGAKLHIKNKDGSVSTVLARSPGEEVAMLKAGYSRGSYTAPAKGNKNKTTYGSMQATNKVLLNSQSSFWNPSQTDRDEAMTIASDMYAELRGLGVDDKVIDKVVSTSISLAIEDGDFSPSKFTQAIKYSKPLFGIISKKDKKSKGRDIEKPSNKKGIDLNTRIKNDSVWASPNV